MKLYLVEHIDDNSKLYYRVHKQYYRNDFLAPSVFREMGSGEEKSMSTDWCKYSTPNELRKRAKKPKDNGIVHFIVGKLRNLNLKVTHAPLCENRAHTDVKGVNNDRIRLLLSYEILWNINSDEPLVSD